MMTSKLRQLAATATDDEEVQVDVFIGITLGARLALRDADRMAGVLEAEVREMGTNAQPIYRAYIADLVDEALRLFDMMDERKRTT